MPRPRKWRKVCFMPESSSFGPLNGKGNGHGNGRGNGNGNNKEVVIMTVDEYETIRLIDLEGMSQEECAKRMNVARTTIQRIYNIARKTLARSLVNGHVLKIEGGNFELCNMDEIKNGCGQCRRGQACNQNL